MIRVMTQVLRTGTIDLRVRYNECDPMGVAHHTVYPVWFELGRTELLRETGITYRELEEEGVLLAVIELQVSYRRPARYDDQLVLTTTQSESGRVKVRHDYELHRGAELLVSGQTTLACLDPTGRAQPVPEFIRQSASR